MKNVYSFLILILVMASCSKNSGPSPTPPPTNTAFFAKGADISWITEMEASGRKFYNTSGVQQDIFPLLQSYGINTIRLRLWVNPANGWNGITDALAKATRAKAAGMKLMLDFHYSDSWADPGQQTKPAAWQSASFTGLNDSLRNYTIRVLTAFKNNNITPEWVQVGNETNDGMLWPNGKASTNMANFAALYKTGYNAVKSVFPDTKVIAHLSNGWDNSLYRWLLDGLKANGADWDVTGLSLYPSPTNWQAYNDQCLSNMNDLIARYGKDVMVVEVGMSWDQPTACKNFLTDLINKTRSIANNRGLGVLYWEPQAYNWQGYTLGCFDMSGKPTAAMDAFK